MFVAAFISLLFQPAPSPSIVDLTRHSSIVFSGSVEKMGASTRDVPTTVNTAIVRVDDVLAQPPELINLKGQRVTVRFDHAGAPPPNGSAVFFTNLYSAGTTVGVDAVGVVRDLSSVQARESLAQARRIIRDQDLAARLAKADLVVVGTVTAVRRVEGIPHLTEHDPEVSMAEIAVDQVVKGQVAGGKKSIAIYFAESRDPFFFFWPKPLRGQKGIFIAHSQDEQMAILRERAPRAPEGLYLIDREDLQPAEELARVRNLLKR